MNNIQKIIEDKRLEESKKKYLKKNAIYSIFSIIGYTIYITYFDIGNSFLYALFMVFIFYPILALLIGSVIANFPYKNLPFSKKYLRACLLALLIMHLITIIGFCIMFIVGSLIMKNY